VAVLSRLSHLDPWRATVSSRHYARSEQIANTQPITRMRTTWSIEDGQSSDRSAPALRSPEKVENG